MLAIAIALAWPAVSAHADAAAEFAACERAAPEWSLTRERTDAVRCLMATRTFLLESRAASDVARAWAVFQQLPAGSYYRRAVLHALIERRLAEKSRALSAATVAGAPALDPGVELDAARAAYRQLRAAYEAVLATPGAKVGYQEHEQDFEDVIAGYLRARIPAEKALVSFARFEWSGWCGTGAELLAEPQAHAIAAAAADMQRYDVAAGALLQWGFLASMGDEESRQRFVAAAGHDWERVYLGALLEGQAGAAGALARTGSAGMARLLLAAADRPQYPGSEQDRSPLAHSSAFLSALAAFVPPSGRCRSYGTASSDDVVRSGAPAPPDVQAQILERIARSVAPGSGRGPADRASHALTRICRVESVPAFRAMTRSPFTEVRRRGALALEALGEKAPSVAPNAPVRFEIVVDGQPLRGSSVDWQIRSGGPAAQTRLSSTATTDVEGRLSLERDPFVDPAAPVGAVVLSTHDPKAPGDLWFSASLEAPANLDAPVPITIATQALTVRCAAPQARQLTLQLTWDRWGSGAVYPQPLGEALPFGGSAVTFARLQQGRPYRVVLSGADGWSWRSAEVALGAAPVVFDCAAPSSP